MKTLIPPMSPKRDIPINVLACNLITINQLQQLLPHIKNLIRESHDISHKKVFNHHLSIKAFNDSCACLFLTQSDRKTALLKSLIDICNKGFKKKILIRQGFEGQKILRYQCPLSFHMNLKEDVILVAFNSLLGTLSFDEALAILNKKHTPIGRSLPYRSFEDEDNKPSSCRIF